MDGVAIESPLNLVIVNFCLQKFEQMALLSAPQKLAHWFQYVDDMFVISRYGEGEHVDFLTHLNSVHHGKGGGDSCPSWMCWL